jgi:type VI secretion system protein ImpH
VKKDLNHEILDEPYRFEFFQAVRLLEKIYPERSSVGRDALPNEEIVRFRSRPILEFPASEIHEIKETFEEYSDAKKLEMFVNFIGLIGPLGVLPTHYTELITDRVRYRDTAMWAFLDIFTHRITSIFFRAWEKYRFPVQYERGNDDFTDYLFDLIGLGTRGLRGRLNVDDEGLLPYAGLILQKPHSTNSIEQIVADYYGIPAKIEQFYGQWLDLEEESWTKLGVTNNRLGVSTVAGMRIWDEQSKFRVKLGPLSFQQFQGFLPNGTAYKSLFSIISFMVGVEFDFDVQLKLKAKEVPSTILTTRAKRKPMLGWSSFLKTKPFTEDDEQVVMQQPN